jgi:hypothetical protein
MAITAKNYAAQAERSLVLLSNTTLKADKAHLDNYAKLIQQAQHFSMPDDGLIFDDGRKGIKGKEIRLPFEAITIEYFCTLSDWGMKNAKDGEVFTPKRVILAYEIPIECTEILDKRYRHILESDTFKKSSHVIMLTSIEGDNGNVFLPIPITLMIPSCWDDIFSDNTLKTMVVQQDGTPRLAGGVPMPFSPYVFEYAMRQLGGYENALQYGVEDISYSLRVFLEFIEALSCKNIEFSTFQSAPTKAEAAKRAKKGKLPIYETKVLSLKTTETKSGIKSTGLRAGHASPRQHLRRGHIRRLESGNIWVNSCIVGDASKGVVHKSYEVMK